MHIVVGRIGEKMFTSGRKCIFSIKLPNVMQMQESLTDSTFDHLFSFLQSLTLSLGRFHVK